MHNSKLIILAMAALAAVGGCKEKKQSEDIIAPKQEAKGPSAPIRMQPYSDSRDVLWLDRSYKIEVNREASDSLPMVKDETGQKFVDNRISVRVLRSDGTVAISKSFTKTTFNDYLTAHFLQAGILEGLVFDKVDGQQLDFAASVSLPLSDEYIPLEVKIDNFGNVKIARDADLDTSGSGEADADTDEGFDEDEI